MQFLAASLLLVLLACLAGGEEVADHPSPSWELESDFVALSPDEEFGAVEDIGTVFISEGGSSSIIVDGGARREVEEEEDDDNAATGEDILDLLLQHEKPFAPKIKPNTDMPHRSEEEKHPTDPERLHHMDDSDGNSQCKKCQDLKMQKCVGWKVGVVPRTQKLAKDCEKFAGETCVDKCWGEEVALDEIMAVVWKENRWCSHCRNNMYSRCKNGFSADDANTQNNCLAEAAAVCVKTDWCTNNNDASSTGTTTSSNDVDNTGGDADSSSTTNNNDGDGQQ